ncbi:toll/interleukin-1 receptor domain-containing adapter protein isoform X2 [Danio rerio]|nr:toll/interleukin-1 receptor domain-containing adapter protein isoform X2 [Danio rerio]|eukprot:XP_002667158.2 toll/interleukin-1 receptor domain-containing adapter protein isoform X2 [Danio rerio]
MEEKRVSGVMSWFRERFGRQRNGQEQINPYENPPPPSHPSDLSISTSICSSSSSHQHLPSFLSSSLRSALKYDLYLCHSEKDMEQAQSLATFLEQPGKSLRCFLQERDCALGGAVSTELLQALRDSHCWLLLITPHFLKDDWCLYQMHQVLSEGPMSQRIIPSVLDMPRSELPLELRFLFTVDLNVNREFGFKQVYSTVLHYLKDVCEKETSSSVSQTDRREESQL